MNKQDLIEKYAKFEDEVRKQNRQILESPFDRGELSGESQLVAMLLNDLKQLDEPEITEERFWVYMSERYRFDKEGFVRKLKENNYLKKHQIVELPMVPQFVALAIEKTKENRNRNNMTILNIFNEVNLGGFYTERVDKWIEDSPDAFARAWLDGYTIEKEPTWTVKLDKGRYVDNFVEFAVGIQIDITSKLDCTAPIRFKDKSKAEAVALLVGGEIVEVTDNV